MYTRLRKILNTSDRLQRQINFHRRFEAGSVNKCKNRHCDKDWWDVQQVHQCYTTNYSPFPYEVGSSAAFRSANQLCPIWYCICVPSDLLNNTDLYSRAFKQVLADDRFDHGKSAEYTLPEDTVVDAWQAWSSKEVGIYLSPDARQSVHHPDGIRAKKNSGKRRRRSGLTRGIIDCTMLHRLRAAWEKKWEHMRQQGKRGGWGHPPAKPKRGPTPDQFREDGDEMIGVEGSDHEGAGDQDEENTSSSESGEFSVEG
ncbi:hypothetical protein B0H14DRAFT_2644348 [Mycena olivaceomarginata]|nr:hypothetical protein B0H14DRAFT_2644348 [Mycena olivaceomarginata]